MLINITLIWLTSLCFVPRCESVGAEHERNAFHKKVLTNKICYNVFATHRNCKEVTLMTYFVTIYNSVFSLQFFRKHANRSRQTHRKRYSQCNLFLDRTSWCLLRSLRQTCGHKTKDITALVPGDERRRKKIVSSWILTSREPHRVTSGR